MIERASAERRVINAARVWATHCKERPYSPHARGIYDGALADDELRILEHAKGYAHRQTERPDPIWFGQHQTDLYDAVMALEAAQ